MIYMSHKKQPLKFTSQIHLQIHPCVLDEIHLSRGDEIHPWVGKEIRPPHVQLNKGDWTPTWLYSATARSPYKQFIHGITSFSGVLLASPGVSQTSLASLASPGVSQTDLASHSRLQASH